MKYLEKEQDFDTLIKEELVLVDFYANWCGPCQMLSPILEELSKTHKNLNIVKVDVDKFQNLARKYGIMSIPTIKIYKNGTLTKESVGYLDLEELETLIK